MSCKQGSMFKLPDWACRKKHEASEKIAQAKRAAAKAKKDAIDLDKELTGGRVVSNRIDKKKAEEEAAQKKAEEHVDAQLNKRTNFVEAEADVEEAETLYARYKTLADKQSEIFMKSDWDEMMKEVGDIASRLGQIKTSVEGKQEQAKTGWFGGKMQPYTSRVQKLFRSVDDAYKLQLPRKFINRKEPLTVRDSFIDYYNAQVKFETQCNADFEELAKMSEELEGTELSSEGRRRLVAVVNCPLKSEVGGAMNASAEKYVEMAKNVKPLVSMAPSPPRKPGNQKMLIGLVALGIIALAARSR